MAKESAKIIFLGTGGGRFVVLNQLLATGGFILEMDGQVIHIDPGPGALVRAKEYGFNLRKLTGVVVSHRHPDHYNDACMVIEAMTEGARKKKGVLIGSDCIINGDKKDYPVVSKYHLNAVEKYFVMKPGDKINVGGIEVCATPTRHAEESGIGFVFRGSKVVGYTSDGEYFECQEKYFHACDCLIINCLRPGNDKWPGHMNAAMAAKLVKLAKPKMAVLQHFGMKMFRIALREAERIGKETGIKTMAAKDGMVLEVGKEKEEKGIRNFVKY